MGVAAEEAYSAVLGGVCLSVEVIGFKQGKMLEKEFFEKVADS